MAKVSPVWRERAQQVRRCCRLLHLNLSLAAKRSKGHLLLGKAPSFHFQMELHANVYSNSHMNRSPWSITTCSFLTSHSSTFRSLTDTIGRPGRWCFCNSLAALSTKQNRLLLHFPSPCLIPPPPRAGHDTPTRGTAFAASLRRGGGRLTAVPVSSFGEQGAVWPEHVEFW